MPLLWHPARVYVSSGDRSHRRACASGGFPLLAPVQMRVPPRLTVSMCKYQHVLLLCSGVVHECRRHPVPLEILMQYFLQTCEVFY